ncbi:MucBP domain-containing protein [uncultured Lactobacillus sp.]|uniref:MucBP domain-containing protein n=1 Tax=uncultured Lactobacillus sp. TaxID=153152 RepID=UPI0025F805EA|nr:MucBP domain-containing protein [uncultured Lactobacillus sp.]
MNSKSNCHHRGKLLFTSLAAATLGLIIMSPDMARADTLVDAAAKKQGAQSSSLPASNNNQTAVSTDSAAANNNQASTTSEPVASNETQPSTSPNSETQDANEPPAVGEEAKGIAPRSILTASWGGLKVTLDTATGIATIPGGTVTNPRAIFLIFEKYYYDYKSLKKIRITGPLKVIGTASYMFAFFENLTEIRGLNQVDTSEVTNMSFMFFGCQNLSSLDLSNFNTTKATSMAEIFWNCKKLTNLNVSSFDTSKVNDMYDMFNGCENLEHLDLRGFNTNKVTNMSMMFAGCKKLSNVDLHSFDTSNVTIMSFMFSNCQSLTSLDLRNFNTAKVTDMSYMFPSTNSLTSLDLSNFDTGKVTDMRGMFRFSTNLKTLNISSFQMAQVTSKSEMLKSIPKLSTLVLGPKNYLQGTGLDVSGVWLNVGNGTVDKPQGNKSWTSSQLMSNYSGSRDQDTYVRLGGAVTVHYRDETGATLAPDQILSGKIGDSYSSEPQNIAGYVVKTTPANAKGTYTDKVQEVTYVYTNQVKVLVHYVDQDGKPIAGAPDQTISGIIDQPYPDNVVKDIKGYILKSKPSGKFSGTETEVTYVYTNQVKVLAHYVDQNGKPVADDDTLNGKIGDDYPDKTIEGYVIQTKPSGKFSGTETEVTYVYTNQVKVLAHYVDQDGKPIADDDTLAGKIGDDYPAKEIAGYVIQTKPTGKFSASVTAVTYVYTNQVKVLAHYVDQDGKPIADDKTLSGKIGDPYPDSAVKDIKGYILKSKPSGKFSGTETEVTYVYTNQVKVLAHYVDQDGKSIAGVTDETLTGTIGDLYPDSAVKDIKGYTLKTKPTGKFSGTETEITYVYTKNAPVNPGDAAGRQPIVGGSVTVHYQDETGKQLAPDQILTGNVGEGYLTQEVALAGYKLTQRPANATGFYTANPQSVTYIYAKNVTGQAAVRRTVFHNSYLYDQNGGRKTGKYLMGKTIWTYGTKVIQGKKYYDLGQDNYVKATNVSGVKRKLRRNSYVYGKTAKKLQRKALKKGQKVRTYGAAVKIHRKLYYIVGKNQYVKKSNF